MKLKGWNKLVFLLKPPTTQGGGNQSFFFLYEPVETAATWSRSILLGGHCHAETDKRAKASEEIGSGKFRLDFGGDSAKKFYEKFACDLIMVGYGNVFGCVMMMMMLSA